MDIQIIADTKDMFTSFDDLVTDIRTLDTGNRL